jgi:membrane protease YdiL (CAAX protease family)
VTPSTNLRAALRIGAAFAAAAVLIIYFGVTKWLVSLGSASSPALLMGQLAAYSSLAAGSLIFIRWLGCDWPWAGRTKLRWIGVVSVAVAIAVLAFRFLWKHPLSGWRVLSAQGLRDILEGYLIGRIFVPLAEELVFRGLLFCFVETSSGKRAVLTVIGTAFGFALLHWPPLYGLHPSDSIIDVMSALAAGLAFGALRGWTKSILPGLGLHIIGNSLGF